MSVVSTLLLTIAAVAGAPSQDESQLQRFAFSQIEMGMTFEIVLYAPDEPAAKDASQAAFTRIHELNAIFSDYDSESELSKLSATAGPGKAVQVTQTLWDVLSYGQEVSRQSEGGFDLTVGPVVKLWRRARRNGRLPDADALAAAVKCIGHENLVLNKEARTAELRLPQMRLDLGGIAVGFAIDDAMKILRQRGITSALIDGSGDIVLGDPPPGKEGWKIGIAPLEPNAPPSVFLTLKNCSVSTSGDAFQHVTIDGKRYSHIVDPKTGLGLTSPASVTIVAPTGMAATHWRRRSA